MELALLLLWMGCSEAPPSELGNEPSLSDDKVAARTLLHSVICLLDGNFRGVKGEMVKYWSALCGTLRRVLEVRDKQTQGAGGGVGSCPVGV